MSVQKHIEQLVGSLIGTTAGLVQAEFSDELHTVKLAAIGAITGFVVTTLLKWLKKKLTRQ